MQKIVWRHSFTHSFIHACCIAWMHSVVQGGNQEGTSSCGGESLLTTVSVSLNLTRSKLRALHRSKRSPKRKSCPFMGLGPLQPKTGNTLRILSLEYLRTCFTSKFCQNNRSELESCSVSPIIMFNKNIMMIVVDSI